jgi:hypothetical protein
MNLYLMRASVEHAEGMAAWLKGHIGHVGVVICSPDDESVTTAKACAKALGSHIADTRVPEQWDEIERLAQQSTDVLVVTDDPGKCLEGWRRDDTDLSFAPGSVAMVSPSTNWLVTAEIVLPDQAIVEAARALTESLTPRERSQKLREAADSGDTEKSWVGGTCEACQENADAGWIPIDDAFPSGDDEPPAHPNCECELETRDASDEDTTP